MEKILCWGFLASIIKRTAPILAILRQKLDAFELEVVEFGFNLSEIFDYDIFEEFVSNNPSTVTEFELIHQWE